MGERKGERSPRTTSSSTVPKCEYWLRSSPQRRSAKLGSIGVKDARRGARGSGSVSPWALEEEEVDDDEDKGDALGKMTAAWLSIAASKPSGTRSSTTLEGAARVHEVGSGEEVIT